MNVDVLKKLAIIFGVVGVLLLLILSIPKFNLNDGDMTILLNSVYKDPGYNASVLNININNKVSTDGLVDTTKVGNYTIHYTLHYISNYMKARVVTVKELDPPTITLVGNEDTYVCPSKDYIEEGYKAIDNYDGDITDKVNRIINGNNITYAVSDTSGNDTTVVRNLVYKDITSPEIELVGGDVTLYVGNTYNEQGYKATDNCLGDITSSVEVSNNINTNIKGSYLVTYKVSDGYNETIKTRNVYIISKNRNVSYERKGVIYLTFDDGPNTTYTPQVVDMLKKYNVKATFFIVPKGNTTDYLIKREYNEGHTVGIHSSSHIYSVVYANDDALYRDISIVNEKIKSITGSYSYIYRYPGGSSNTVSRNYSKGIISRTSVKLHEMGYHYFDWNVSSGDADGKSHSSSDLANNIINSLSRDRANVVLIHDIHPSTAGAVEEVISYGLKAGYSFSNITMDTQEVHHRISN